MAPTKPTGPSSNQDDPPLLLREWQLFHTYSSYYRNPLPPLEDVARNLVRCAVAECAITSEGAAFWSKDDPRTTPSNTDRRHNAIGSGDVHIEASHSRRSARVHLPADSTKYSAQAMLEWSWSRHSELLLFGDAPLPPRYVWAQLGACTFLSNKPKRSLITVYPQLKIFETGVVLVHFRMFSPAKSVRLRQYISNYLNASLQEFCWAMVPPGVAAWSPLAIPQAGILNWYRRPWTAYVQWRHQRELARYTSIAEMGDFSFRHVSIGLVAEQAILAQALTAALPDIQRAADEAMRSVAASHGVRFAPGMDGYTVDPDVYLNPEPQDDRAESVPHAPVHAVGDTHNEKQGAETPAAELSEDGPPSGSSAGFTANPEARAQSGRRSVDLDRLENEMEHAAEAEVRRLSQIISDDLRNASGVQAETFRTVALTIMRVAGYVGGTWKNGPRRGVSLAVNRLGRVNDVGTHWTGRPHSFLFRFAHQSSSASDNLERFAADFGAILARENLDSPDHARNCVPPSTRAFDDFGAHITGAGSLWVHGKQSLKVAGSDAQQNREHLVNEHKARVELLEYGYSLHRRIADRVMSEGREASAAALLGAQRDLTDFEWALQDTGQFGEVRDQLEAGWQAYGVPKMRQRISDGLRSRQEQATYHQGIRTEWWTTFIALLAGLLAAPPLVDVIVRPAWILLGLPRPANGDVFSLVLAFAAILCVVVVLMLGRVARNTGCRNVNRKAK